MVGQQISAVGNGLLVGVNYYPDPKVTDLRFAVDDASELYNVLTSPPYHFGRERLTLLRSVDDQCNEASRRNILRQLLRVAGQGQQGELLLFYYAGHGVSVKGVPYLCPSDVEYGLLQETSIPLPRLREIVANSRASVKLMIFDACQMGVPLGRKGNGAAFLEEVREFGEQARKVFADVKGIAMLAASSLEEIAKEDDERKHGAFTWFLLEALRGLHEVEQNKDNRITVTELFHYVAERLKQEYGQEATILLEGSGDLPIFTLPPRPLPLNPVSPVFPQPVKKPQEFFDQEEALRKVREKLLTTADILIFVHGERGIGRTSFINRLKSMLDEESHADMRFLHFSIEPGSIRTVADLARELWGGLVEVCRRASPGFSWNRPFAFESYAGFGFELEAMLRALPEARFVVFLDDAEKLFEAPEKLLDKQVLALITFIIHRTNLPIAFVISSLYEQERFFKEYGSPPSTLDIPLIPLQRADCDTMLDALFGGNIEGKETLYEWIYRLSGGNPYLVKLLASTSWETNPTLKVEDSERDHIIKQATEEASPLFTSVYEDIITERERFVLLNLALRPQFVLSATELAEWKTDQRTAARTLEQRRFYLLSLPEGGYRLRVELLGEWLRRWPNFPLECERLGLNPATPSESLPDPEGICLDLSCGKVYVDGKEVQARLSDLQYRALLCLAQRAGQVVSRQELYEALHASDETYLPTDQSLDALIYRLRIALGDRSQRYLQTLRKRGYLLAKGRVMGKMGSQSKGEIF